MTYESGDNNSGTFNLGIDLSSINSLLGNDLKITLTHGINESNKRNELQEFSLNGDLANIMSLIKVSIDFKVKQVTPVNYYSSLFESNWNDYIRYFNEDDNYYYELETCKQACRNGSWGKKYYTVAVTYKDSKTPIIVK